MLLSTLDALVCSSCRRSYEVTAHEAAGGRVLTGHLRCPGCAIVIPIAQGFALFTEPLLHEGQATPEELRRRGEAWFGTRAQYAAYRQAKRARGALEIYAAFQPFNESTRAIGPALRTFLAGLRPGDFVLDPWCRSGWSAEWLARLCPEQTVVALWEGDRSVLGYRGFAHWLAVDRRSPNLEVMFVHPERGLPFADGQFGATYALDAFHRFSPQPFAGELIRTARADAPIALAHLHLSNSEPDPYFDRGGQHWHGRDYDAWVQRLAQTSGRIGRVFSEDDLFESEGAALPAANPDTPHYNGFVLLTAEAAREPAAAAAADPGAQRLLVNPLFTLHLQRDGVSVRAGLHDGAVGELLRRHPIYEARLPSALVPLNAVDLAITALAVVGETLAAIGATLGLDDGELQARLARLEAVEFLRRAAISRGGFDLQRFHANQKPLDDGAGALAALLAGLGGRSDPALRTTDGAEVSGAELQQTIATLAAGLRAQGLQPGARITLGDPAHPLSLALALAALSAGLVVGGDAEPPGEVALFVGDGGDGRAAMARRSLPFEPGAAAGPSLLDLLSHPAPDAGLGRTPAGALRLPLGGRIVTLDADTLCEAADSLAAAAGASWEPIAQPFRMADVLCALIALHRRETLTLRL